MSRTPGFALPVVTTVAFLLAVPGCAGRSAKPAPAAADTSPPALETTSPGGRDQSLTLVVYGMGCPLCANNVDKQLLKIVGVQRVDVNLGSGSVKVQYAGKAPSREQLAKAVADSGYTLVRVEGI